MSKAELHWEKIKHQGTSKEQWWQENMGPPGVPQSEELGLSDLGQGAGSSPGSITS